LVEVEAQRIKPDKAGAAFTIPYRAGRIYHVDFPFVVFWITNLIVKMFFLKIKDKEKT